MWAPPLCQPSQEVQPRREPARMVGKEGAGWPRAGAERGQSRVRGKGRCWVWGGGWGTAFQHGPAAGEGRSEPCQLTALDTLKTQQVGGLGGQPPALAPDTCGLSFMLSHSGLCLAPVVGPSWAPKARLAQGWTYKPHHYEEKRQVGGGGQGWCHPGAGVPGGIARGCRGGRHI